MPCPRVRLELEDVHASLPSAAMIERRAFVRGLALAVRSRPLAAGARRQGISPQSLQLRGRSGDRVSRPRHRCVRAQHTA
jgi:hypothetical protein